MYRYIYIVLYTCIYIYGYINLYMYIIYPGYSSCPTDIATFPATPPWSWSAPASSPHSAPLRGQSWWLPRQCELVKKGTPEVTRLPDTPLFGKHRNTPDVKCCADLDQVEIWKYNAAVVVKKLWLWFVRRAHMLALCWAHVGPSWAYVVPMLGLYWPYGEACWAMLGLCWAHSFALYRPSGLSLRLAFVKSILYIS